MSTKKPIVRRDATGHLDPEYQRKLLESSQENHGREDDAHAFVNTVSREELSEELGESFIQGATSNDDAEMERREQVLTEEEGGPFVPSTAGQEFAGGTDESNIAEATREPVPTTSSES